MKPDKENIKNKIDNRIEKMLLEEQGLNEIFSVFSNFKNKNIEIDFNKGLLQAIGYKEFFPLYEIINSNFNDFFNFNTYDQFKEFFKKKDLEKLYDECLNRLKINTFQYAKYQLKFIEQRILPFLINSNNVLITDPFNSKYLDQITDFIKAKFFYSDVTNFVQPIISINKVKFLLRL